MVRFILTLLITISTLSAEDLSLHRNQISVGPQWRYVERMKRGKKHQTGSLWGFQISYDRLKCWGWYWGAEGDYSNGILRNRTPLRSRFIDMWGEGRFGYTFQQVDCMQLAFTPFVGGGYVLEKNYFTEPSPLLLRFKTYYSYVAGGFRYWMHPFEDWEVGILGKVKVPIDPQCRVSNDPENEPVTQNISIRAHYRLDVPVTYRISCRGECTVVLDPFLEWRHYGSQINYPFDFIDTRLRMWGILLSFQYRF